MDDLQTYRSRIGLFRYSSMFSQKGPFFSHSSVRKGFGNILTFFLFVSLAADLYANDPSVELNPGPPKHHQHRKKIDFWSDEEKDHFNSLQTLNSDIVRICSHRYFLRTCKELNLVPRGLCYKISLATCKTTKELEHLFSEISKKFSFKLIDAIIEHYNIQLIALLKTTHESHVALSLRTTSSRMRYLSNKLLQDKEQEANTLQITKLHKIDTLLDIYAKAPTDTHWLPDLNLSTTEQDFINKDEELDDAIINAGMNLLNRDFPHFDFQSSSLNHTLLNYCPTETIHIHHNGHGHFVCSSSISGEVKIYDSLNSTPSEELLSQIKVLYSPDPSVIPTVQQPHLTPQQGSVDCGIFALAYATELVHFKDPSSVTFDQSKMRQHLTHCLERRKMQPFPKFRTHVIPSKYHEVTSNYDNTQKWSKPSHSSPPKDNQPFTVPTQNRFSILEEAPDGDPQASLAASFKKRSPLSKKSSPPKKSTPPCKMSPQNEESTRKTKINHHSLVTNLSSRHLSKIELSTLELGLSFCPSVKDFNQEKVCDDFYNFIRRLKLKDYFKDNCNSHDTINDSDDDRISTGWIRKNPGWYPKEVQQNRSPPLVDFIDNMVKDTNESLKANKSSFWSNLTNNQRQALTNLSNDTSIVIKPADKSGGIVIMDSREYEDACLDQLSDPEFYEEMSSDPTQQYRDNVNEAVNNLHKSKLINSMEHDTLLEGHRTPFFYGMPKMHNFFDNFPPLRPICSGHNSPTVKLSELVDSFLKAAAIKTRSYIKDTTDFINKTRHLLVPCKEAVFLVTLDVNSLYTNIDHTEGIQACKFFLDQRTNQHFPSSTICDLTNLILKSNAMKFTSRIFHQVKGVAMGTPMAVNFSTLFMTKFEQLLLNEYEKSYGVKPFVWLRYIDDIFMVWTGTEKSLQHFLEFANQFSKQQGMKSTITFKAHYSQHSVNFLDTSITLEHGNLVTNLYTKNTAAHDYVRHSSYHPKHTLRSLPKSQFMRIRRICSKSQDYKIHAQNFIQHFIKRGYKESELRKCATDVASMDREELLTHKKPQTRDRVPLVITYQHKLQDIPRIIHNNYRKMITNHPEMKDIFPDPPIVSYRRPQNIFDKLVRADHTRSTCHTKPTLIKTASFIDPLMNNSGKITNPQTNTTCHIMGGNATDSHITYAATCKKHQLVCVGYTTTQLNERFNRHRSDVKLRPERCELTQHFAKHGCDFNKDLEVSILGKISGSEEACHKEEDRWISRLQTREPNGMNVTMSEYGGLFHKLFN